MNKFYAGVLVNAAAGLYLYTVQPEAIPTLLYWIFIVSLPLLAVLSILTFGTLAVGWALLMSDKDLDVIDYAPGSKQAKALYDATVNTLGKYDKTRFYLSFISSMLLIVGISQQGWTYILVIEVLGSAIGYGFLHWVLNNISNMHSRTYGNTE